ncbi:hypothetical protein ANN_04633 [Periplaneta americana]|uniref:Uncharacterized protein n=1 Tax=Periplaneta americana TaxID=6978 RepID=A0ABQ8TAW8_PERAM|nr:hypothetical protein ANN_04633 [Periplaneta americana]
MWIWRRMEHMNWIGSIRNEAVLERLFNNAVSIRPTSLFNVDGLDGSEIVFGEMRPRIHHRLPDIRLIVEEDLGEILPDTTHAYTDSCPQGEALRNARHHQVQSIIATALKDADYNTFEEIHGLSVTGSTRRIDIIAFKESTRSGFIIDPTLRFEMNEEQPAEVNKEKRISANLPFPITSQSTG